MPPDHQMHGKNIENLLKGSGFFSYSATDKQRAPNENFDVAGTEDPNLGYPTSIKATGSSVVALSDARKFWQSFDHAPWRMLVCCYQQSEKIKEFHTIHEFIFAKEHRAVFFGNIAFKQIADFHNTIGLEQYPRGEHIRARLHAREVLEDMKSHLGIVALNPKIDSKSQRRLQCSVLLSDLLEHFSDPEAGYKLHTKNIGTMLLPINIISDRRKFRAPKA